MRPIYSDEDRNRVVRNFIDARYQGLAKIKSFGEIVPYLGSKRLKLLYPLEQSGSAEVGEYAFDRHIRTYYTENDAETYFDWLTHVVTGAENASEDMIKQANDQLFIFILALRKHTEIDKRVQLVEPYDWEYKINNVIHELSEIKRTMDRGDSDVLEVLKSILQWMKKYNPVLNEIDKERKKIFGKGKNQ